MVLQDPRMHLGLRTARQTQGNCKGSSQGQHLRMLPVLASQNISKPWYLELRSPCLHVNHFANRATLQPQRILQEENGGISTATSELTCTAHDTIFRNPADTSPLRASVKTVPLGHLTNPTSSHETSHISPPRPRRFQLAGSRLLKQAKEAESGSLINENEPNIFRSDLL